jgi:hypothetical protein
VIKEIKMNTIVNITGITLKLSNINAENAMQNKTKQKLAIAAKYMRKWRKKNKIKIKEYKKQWRLKNLEKVKLQDKRKREKYKTRIAEKSKDYYYKNKKYLLKYAKQYRIKNREKINIRKREYTKLYEQRLEVKIIKRLRKRIRHALQNAKKSDTTLNLTGIGVSELKKYIELKFKKGMNWEKFKEGIIHIDHIKPCISFDLTKPEEQSKCFHYTNLQPLWASENLAKGSKISS